MKPQIVFDTPLPVGITKSILNTTLQTTLQSQKATLPGLVHVSFVTKAESRQINSTNTGNDYPTDVLSLAYPVDDSEQGRAAAEILICTPIAQAQAKQYNVSLKEEVSLLFVHGILHILGHDHQTTTEQAMYEQTQNAIMKKLNLTARSMSW